MGSCPANVRDLGRLPLVGGGVTRPGVLLRGDASFEGDEPPLPTWPPNTVIDLRGAHEYEAAPPPWPDRTRVIRHALYDAASIGGVPDDQDLVTIYEGILATAAERVAAVVGLLDPLGVTLIHCAAGKDRTGVVVAALLLLTGVEPDTVVADYRRSEDAMPRVLERLYAHGALQLGRFRPALAATPHEAIATVVDRLTGWPGGPRSWHIDHGADPSVLDGFVARFAASRTQP